MSDLWWGHRNRYPHSNYDTNDRLYCHPHDDRYLDPAGQYPDLYFHFDDDPYFDGRCDFNLYLYIDLDRNPNQYSHCAHLDRHFNGYFDPYQYASGGHFHLYLDDDGERDGKQFFDPVHDQDGYFAANQYLHRYPDVDRYGLGQLDSNSDFHSARFDGDNDPNLNLDGNCKPDDDRDLTSS